MDTQERLCAELDAAVSGADSALGAADRLCLACVELLEVDGVSLSLTLDGSNRGTFGASSALSRRLDALQFTAGEGPCLDAVASGRPVLVADLDDAAERRWPGFTGAVLAAGVRAVFALPVSLSRQRVGALDLYRIQSGALTPRALTGGLLAAELAALPLLDLIAEHAAAAGVGEQDQDAQRAARLPGAGRGVPGHRHAHRGARRRSGRGAGPAPRARLHPGTDRRRARLGDRRAAGRPGLAGLA